MVSYTKELPKINVYIVEFGECALHRGLDISDARESEDCQLYG